MASSVVIKVKYGDTLRRFNAGVNEDQNLDLDLHRLRSKICSLFDFNAEAKFTLTYIDEDDDQVTLAEDEDLYDVMRQGLNPVRITVHLSTDKNAHSSTKSSGSSTTSRTSSQNLADSVNPGVAEVLKSVPEPLRDALSKLSLELSSKAASTSPLLADIVGNLTKMGQSYLSPSGSRSCAADVNNHDEVSGQHQEASASKKPEVSKNEEMKLNVKQTPSFVEPNSNSSPASDSVEVVTGAQPVGPHVLPSPLLNKEKDAKSKQGAAVKRVGSKKDKGILKDSARKSEADELAASIMRNHLRIGDVRTKEKKFPKKETNEGTPSENKRSHPFFNDFRSECPFAGLPHPSLAPFVPPPSQPSVRSSSNADGMVPIFHRGIRCDGCGVIPITGARFKSLVKHDYDLCSICFQQMGNYADYTKIDFPLQYTHSRHFIASRFPSMQMPSMMGRSPRSGIDSCFIMDVNVLDGTLMAPSTPFTKIWRLRNNGTIPWLRGLQLLWIGGERFSRSDSVEIELPLKGVDVGGEIDVAVDFIAPELPGSYTSFWRMATRSGHKFGQRVWVKIEVDASLNLTYESSTGLNLNLPPESTATSAAPIHDMNELPLEVEAGEPVIPLDGEKPSVVEQKPQIELEDLNFPINDDLLVSSQMASPILAASSSSASPANPVETPATPVESPVSYPEVDAPFHPPPATAPQEPVSYPIVDMSEQSSAASSKSEDGKNPGDEVEKSLLKELEQMGFKQIELNKEVLRMNDYDLEKSLDDLCGASEWDPILEELQEMGFHDKTTNRKLLVKNNGSIMRVVMDLIAGEKA